MIMTQAYINWKKYMKTCGWRVEESLGIWNTTYYSKMLQNKTDGNILW